MLLVLSDDIADSAGTSLELNIDVNTSLRLDAASVESDQHIVKESCGVVPIGHCHESFKHIRHAAIVDSGY